MQGSVAEKEKLAIQAVAITSPFPQWVREQRAQTLPGWLAPHPSQGRTVPAPAPHPQVWLSLMFLVLSRSLELVQFTLLLIHRQFGYLSILPKV